MELVFLCVLLGFCASGNCLTALVSASQDGFFFIKSGSHRAGGRACKICYSKDDCIAMNQARCDYYSEASRVLLEDEASEDLGNPELRMQVDTLVMDFIEQASDPAFKKCIPFISQYTDCTKENICLGCTSCTCTENGLWNCTTSQRCQPEEPLRVDHRTLAFAMETLREDEKPLFRKKRSLSSTKAPRSPRQITFDELSEWLYEAQPLNSQEYENTTSTTEITTMSAHHVGTSSDDINIIVPTSYSNTTNTESDYVAFDDVLNDISIEITNYDHKKTPKDVKDIEHDYMNLEDVNITYNEIHGYKIADQFIHMLNSIEEDNRKTVEPTTTEAVTEALMGSLDGAKNKLAVDDHLSNNTDLKSDLSKTLQNYNISFENTNDIEELNLANIMKRDVSQISGDNLNITHCKNPNTTSNQDELRDGIFKPLNKVISKRKEELEDLLHIRDKLIEVLQFKHSNKSAAALSVNETTENNDTPHYSFYNVEVIPKLEYDFRKSDIDKLEKILRKLKHDIFTVMGDVAIIQRLKGNLTQEIKNLIRVMKHYVHRHGNIHSKVALKSYDEIDSLRRHSNIQNISEKYLTNSILNILQVLDKQMFQNNALTPLSGKTRKVIRQIMNNFKMEDYSIIGFRAKDPDYNLTNDLKSIGSKWQDMTVKIAESAPWDKLYNMKLLQFILEADVNKMNDALALIDFAHSRRILTAHDSLSEGELLRINTDLKSIHNKVQKIITLRADRKKQETNNDVKVYMISKQSKKDKFLKHIRNLIKNSKKDIIKLLHKKVPKSEIVKELAKKKLNELTKKKLIEYQNVMQKWQSNLDVNIRRKRSAVNFLKHILPKYLRGKVSPKKNSTKSKNQNKNTNVQYRRNRKSQNKRNRNNRRKNTNATTTSPLKVPVVHTGK